MTDSQASRDHRQQRLAQALRDNLKRRKAQIRGRADSKEAEVEGSQGEVSGQKG
jgi:hypothetical protein